MDHITSEYFIFHCFARKTQLESEKLERFGEPGRYILALFTSRRKHRESAYSV